MLSDNIQSIKDIDNIKVDILTKEEIEKYAVCEITHTKLEGENSLYDVRMGPTSNEICGTCNEDIWNCPGHFGFINLQSPIPNPIHKKMILIYLSIFCRNCYKNLFTKERAKLLDMKNVFQISEECKTMHFCPHCNYKIPEFYNIDDRYYIKIDDKKFLLSYYEIVKNFENIKEDEFLICKLKKNLHPKNLIMYNVPVSPICCRPYMTIEGEKFHDDRTYKYIDIIKTNEKIKETKSDKIKNDLIDALYFHIKTIYDNSQGKAKDVCRKRPLKCIKQRISGKKGLIRGCIQGKRTHFTGRTVITPEVNLMTDEIVLPPEFSEELTFPIKINNINIKQCYDLLYSDKVKYIIRDNKYFNASYAINTPGFKLEDYDVILRDNSKFDVWHYENTKNKKFILKPNDIVIRNGKIQTNTTVSIKKNFELKIGDIIERKLQDGDWVLLNRQPTLWKGSMRAKKVKILPGNTIRFSLASTAAFNADFDGDEMNIHPAQSYETKVECEQILSVKANFMSSQDSKPLLSFKQDAMTGGYKLTYGFVKIPKYVFFDCIMIFPNIDIEKELEHIKQVHKWKGLTDKEINKLKIKYPNMSLEDIEQLAEDNLLFTGHSLFSLLLPNDFEYFCNNKICPLGNPIEVTRGVLLSGTLNKVALGNSSGSLIHHLFKDYSDQIALDFVSYYQILINSWLIHHGFSIGLEDCIAKKTDIIDKEINNCLLEAEAVMKSEKDSEVLEFRVSNILNKATTLGQKIAKESLEPTNNLVSMIKSGAKGNDFNVTQITGIVGQQCVSGERIPKLFKGRTLPHFHRNTFYLNSVDILSSNIDSDVSKIIESRGFVRNSYYQGLTPTEFFFHACGGREGLIDTACKTATTGYIQRKMVKILEDIHFNYNNMVVNNQNQILEFSYGNDNMDPAKLIKTNYGFSFIDVEHTTNIINKNFEWNKNLIK